MKGERVFAFGEAKGLRLVACDYDLVKVSCPSLLGSDGYSTTSSTFFSAELNTSWWPKDGT